MVVNLNGNAHPIVFPAVNGAELDDSDDDDAESPTIIEPDEDAYAILGVDVNASTQEVQSAYRRLVKQYHPDRAVKSSSELDRFHQITTAGQHIRDRYHRLLYDLHHGIREVPEAEFHEIISHIRLRAITMVSNMAETVKALRAIEYQRDGVIIVKALYGDLKHRGALDRPPGSCIDVTIPVQCMVQCSELVDHSRTKIFLDGFYDPCPHEHDKLLFIRYIFQNVLHQICYADSDEVRIPMRSHSISRADVKEKHLDSTLATFPIRKQAVQRQQRHALQRRRTRIRTLRIAGTAIVFFIGTAGILKSQGNSILAVLRRGTFQRN
uniref:J domain-containing protein n=1 Tax=Spongospora subterranea TaxID=70186 RepID=A0A0H5R7K8_9EUKA|eukprot:CRZ10103.1 hypothetical protein [Spongospora subterranea]